MKLICVEPADDANMEKEHVHNNGGDCFSGL